MAENSASWTFLTNHSHVLFSIFQTPDIRVRDISGMVGVTERAVLRIIRELTDAGFVVVTKNGRENQYSVTADVQLRHPLEQHRSVADLLEMLSKREDDVTS